MLCTHTHTHTQNSYVDMGSITSPREHSGPVLKYKANSLIGFGKHEQKSRINKKQEKKIVMELQLQFNLDGERGTSVAEWINCNPLSCFSFLFGLRTCVCLHFLQFFFFFFLVVVYLLMICAMRTCKKKVYGTSVVMV